MSKLPALGLERRSLLPEKPSAVSLQGRRVKLEPLIIERDAHALFNLSNGTPLQLGTGFLKTYHSDELIWRYMFDGPFKNIDEFIDSLLLPTNMPNGLCLCIFDVGTGVQVGVATLMSNLPSHLKIELGGIWYSPIVQRTLANTKTTYLMLQHCFELGYCRLEWKSHASNERPRGAALRMGFKFEGIQENHMIVKECSRDTAWFRILDREWPKLQKNFERLLYPKH